MDHDERLKWIRDYWTTGAGSPSAADWKEIGYTRKPMYYWFDEAAKVLEEQDEDSDREKILAQERAKLRSMILEEKGRSGLESTKSVDRLIAAIQQEGFTVD